MIVEGFFQRVYDRIPVAAEDSSHATPKGKVFAKSW